MLMETSSLDLSLSTLQLNRLTEGKNPFSRAPKFPPSSSQFWVHFSALALSFPRKMQPFAWMPPFAFHHQRPHSSAGVFFPLRKVHRCCEITRKSFVAAEAVVDILEMRQTKGSQQGPLSFLCKVSKRNVIQQRNPRYTHVATTMETLP